METGAITLKEDSSVEGEFDASSKSASFTSTSQSIGATSYYTLTIALGSSDYKHGVIIMCSNTSSTSGFGNLVHFNTAGEQTLEYTKYGNGAYSRVSGFCTGRFYTSSQQYVNCQSVKINGSNIELKFYNPHTSAQTLVVRGVYVVYK